MKAIVCVDKEWGIGKGNEMLFHLPADLKFFKEKTVGKVIVMGGNTLLSFPGSKPLKDRTNIVLTDVYTRDDCKVVPTLEALKEELKKYPSEEIFVVGGAMFYSSMIDYCSEAFVTKVDEAGGAEVFFPNLDEKENWEEVSSSEPVTDNGHTVRFTTYKNKSIREL